MKKSSIVSLMIVVVFIFSCLPSLATAADPKPLMSKGDIKKEEEARQALRKKIMAKKDELNGSQWEIEIKSQAGKGDYLGKDTLTFQNEKFRSAKTEKNGYGATNYTLTVSEDEQGPTIWETMQTSKDGEVTFWRGEWKDDSMTGVISRQLKDKNEDYYFGSSGKTIIPKTLETAESADINVNAQTVASRPAATMTSAPTTTSSSAASSPEKKSWFF